MPESIPNVQHAYDLAADEYAKKFLEELKHKPQDVEWLQQFADSIDPAQTILDLGCGPGHTTAHLASLGLNPTGIDLSPNMIGKAKTFFPDVSFETGDFFHLPYSNDSVAGILAFYCIVHLQSDQLKTAFTEWLRVLTTGGRLFVGFHIGEESVYVEKFLDTDANLEFSPFPVDTVQTALKRSGFKNLETHVRPPYEIEYPTTRCYIFAQK